METKQSAAADAEALLDALRRYSAALDLLDEAVARRLGIHRTDWSALQCLDAPLTAGQLAEAVHLSLPATTSLIHRLESASYVRRSEDPGDHRRVVVEATDLARRRVEQVFKGLAEAAAAEILSAFDPTEVALIRRFIEKSDLIVRAHTEELRKAGVPPDQGRRAQQ
jgi:DNA-binding MarR family transcriptional regulator